MAITKKEIAHRMDERFYMDEPDVVREEHVVEIPSDGCTGHMGSGPFTVYAALCDDFVVLGHVYDDSSDDINLHVIRCVNKSHQCQTDGTMKDIARKMNSLFGENVDVVKEDLIIEIPRNKSPECMNSDLFSIYAARAGEFIVLAYMDNDNNVSISIN